MYDEIIARWKKANPEQCHALGIHDYDGQLSDLSVETLNNRINEIREDLDYLQNLNTPTERIELYEYELLKSVLETELFELDVRQEFKNNPALSVFPLALVEMSYTARSFAPIEERVKHIIEFENRIPLFLQQSLNLYDESMPASKIGMAIQFLTGIIGFFKDRLITFITKIDDEELIDQWSEANIKAIASIEDFLQKLQTEYMPKAHNNFALGSEKFSQLLVKTEGVNVDINMLLQIGQQDLDNNYQQLQNIADEITEGDLKKLIKIVKSDIPKPDSLIETVEMSLGRTRQFLLDSDLVTVPDHEQLQVIHTPDFARSFAFAAMSPPGPFENKEASEAYYWVTPPNHNWPEERQNTFLEFFNKASLEIVTVHEAWPGHYLQLLYNNKAKSTIAKMFARSTTMIEGWGHYSEEMIYEAGYAPFDRKILHAGQLIGALVRNVRYIAAIKMHCMKMTVQEATQLFIEKAFMGPDNAMIEANRGTIDPMYLNYTLGKLLIKKLRDDLRKEKGDEFSLKEFHDTLLSFGSPPITVLRKLLLKNSDTKII
jgi:uncharacterized protein (DUF885 family)